MKPFNLRAALSGAKCVTRDGLLVSEIHYFASILSFSSICAIINGDPYWYRLNGKHVDNADFDLFLAPNKKTLWVSVYRNADKSLFAKLDHLEPDNESNCIATFSFEIEE